MKYAVADYGMNGWEGGLYDLEERLEMLRRIGFNGIERLEAGDSAEAVKRAAIFHRLGMDFATCRGPRIEQTIEWTSAFGKEYTWLIPGELGRSVSMDDFCRRSNKMIAACRKNNIVAAIHNHLGQRIENQDELDFFMKQCPEAGLLLDVGHLFGAGGDVCATIEKYFDRIVAVHFKDLFIKDASIGLDKWYDKLRFCELGAGNAGFDFEAPAALLKRKGFDKWVMVEHDTHLREPEIDLKVSIDALKKIFD